MRGTGEIAPLFNGCCSCWAQPHPPGGAGVCAEQCVMMPGSVCKGSWLQEAAPALQVTSSAYSAQHLLVPYRQIKALWRRISTQMYRHKVEVYIQLNILFYGKMNK